MGVSASNELGNVARVDLALERTTFSAGEVVKGYVDLNVSKPTTLSTVTVVCLGEATTAVETRISIKPKMKGSGGTKHKKIQICQSVKVVAQEAVVAQFPGDQAPVGRYQCPFQFTLPPNALSSMLKVKDGPNTAALCYSIGVTCHRPGWMKKSLVHRVPIEVIGLPPSKPPERVKDDIQISNCCFSAGHIALAATPAKNAYPEGEKQIAFWYEIDNQSSHPITEVRARLIERVWWKADCDAHATEKELGAAYFPGVGEKSKLGFGDAANPPKQGVMELPPTFQRFTVDDAALCPTINVSLEIELTASPSGTFVDDVFIRVPVHVFRRNPLGLGPHVLPSKEEGVEEDCVPFASPVPFSPNQGMLVTRVPGVQHSAVGQPVTMPDEIE